MNRWLESYLVHNFRSQVPFRRQPIRRRRQQISQGIELGPQLRNPVLLKLTRNSTTTMTLARMHRTENWVHRIKLVHQIAEIGKS